MEFPNRIREIRLSKTPRMSMEKLAALADTSAPQIDRLEKGQRRLTQEWMDRLSKALNVRPADLLPANVAQQQLPGVPLSIAPNVAPAPDAPNLQGLPIDIPVYGVAAGGGSGSFQLNIGDPIDFIKRFPGIAGRKGIFAIYMIGESMRPWRKPGDPVYLDPHRPPRIGDYVVIEFHEAHGEPGDAYCKLLIAMTPTKLRLEQHNPPDDRIEIARSKVKRIIRVIDWPELVGF